MIASNFRRFPVPPAIVPTAAVGQRFAAPSSGVYPGWLFSPFPRAYPWAVGHDEEPLALVRGADFRRLVEAFRDPVASALEVRSDNVEVSKPKVVSHVLEEAPIWAALIDDSEDVRPEVPRVVGAAPLAGDAERLARVAANDAIHDSTPRAAVEGSEIRPNRRIIQGAFRHTRNQVDERAAFVFHVADCASRFARQTDAEIEPAGSGAEAKHIEGTLTHTYDASCIART